MFLDLGQYDAPAQRPEPEFSPEDTALLNAFNNAEAACRKHAAHCQKCYIPIMDAEGNPGLTYEACSAGAVILASYNFIENRILKLLQRENDHE